MKFLFADIFATVKQLIENYSTVNDVRNAKTNKQRGSLGCIIGRHGENSLLLMTNPNMLKKVMRIHETFRAYGARIRLLAGMHPHVSHQTAGLSETFAADLTRVRFHPLVYSHVQPQRTAFAKSLQAHLAGERFLARVRFEVTFQDGGGVEALLASGAAVPAFARIVLAEVVFSEGGTGGEGHAADFAHEGFFAGMHGHMSL